MTSQAHVQFVKITKEGWLSDSMMKKVSETIFKSKGRDSSHVLSTFELMTGDDSKVGIFVIATPKKPTHKELREIISKYISSLVGKSKVSDAKLGKELSYHFENGVGLREINIDESQKSEKIKASTSNKTKKSKGKRSVRKRSRKRASGSKKNSQENSRKRKKSARKVSGKKKRKNDDWNDEKATVKRVKSININSISDKLNVPYKGKNKRTRNPKKKEKRTKTTGRYHNLFKS